MHFLLTMQNFTKINHSQLSNKQTILYFQNDDPLCFSFQTAIGADIIMQLDDVVDATHTDQDRFEEARHRTVRWLDRCIDAHKNTEKQNLFPIVQGGLDADLRRKCAKELIQRDTPGFAIGGLSGGEDKDHFWRMVAASTEVLPRDKPRLE